MYGIILLLHITAATIWTGGHLVLSCIVLPRAIALESPKVLLEFETRYEKIGLPALIVQILTGIYMAYRLLPEVSQWFSPESPLSRPIMAKLLILTVTVCIAMHARFRVIPTLTSSTLHIMKWHIIAVTVLSVLFVIVGVSFRTGWLY